ncbi:MAG: flagellar hook-length control protein FliK [Granulosicoccus sp.]
MNDHKASSPINLFKAPSSSSLSGPSAFSGTREGNSFDMSFSRELSRASEKSASAKEPLNRQRRNNVEAGNRQLTQRSERSRSTDRKDSANAAEKIGKKPADAPESSPGAQEKALRPSEKSSSTATDTKNSQKDDVRSGRERSEKSPRQSVDGEGAELEEARRVELQASATKDATALKPDITGENNAKEELPAEFIAGVDTSDGFVTSEGDTSHIENVENAETLATSGTDVQTNGGVVLTTTTRDSVATPIASESELTSPNARKRSSGEHLSPGQLASRQAYLFKNVSIREPNTTAPAQQLIADEVPGTESVIQASRSASIAAVGIGPMVEATKDKSQKPVAVGITKVDDSGVKSTLLQSMTSDSSNTAVDAKRLQPVDDDSAANLAVLTAAQKSEKHVVRTNQTQALQLAQKQAQSINVATSVISAEPVERAPQSTDNTFLSLQGGIVTAPSVTRSDAGKSQTINAPINMPILQNDADKAMAGNIRWMVNEGVKNAVVNVTPTGMGPISVSIGIEKEQMNVSIVALQGSTREALDSMLPRLREQLAAQGHDSVRVDISDGRADQSDRGYGHQFTEEQNGSEQGDRLSGDRNQNEESDEGTGTQSESVVAGSQGFTTFNESGQIRSRYDVYV